MSRACRAMSRVCRAMSRACRAMSRACRAVSRRVAGCRSRVGGGSTYVNTSTCLTFSRTRGTWHPRSCPVVCCHVQRPRVTDDPCPPLGAEVAAVSASSSASRETKEQPAK
eukprot:502276-Prymnesium_polylepis.1